MAAALGAPDAQMLLTHEQLQQQQQEQQQQQQLSPYQAVQVLQAFLPLQPQQTQPLSSEASKEQQQQQQQQQEKEEEAFVVSAEMGESEEGTDLSGGLGSDPLVYLKMKVRADLKRESVRGVCTLQHGMGSSTKLAVFCSDEEAPQLLALGADFAGCDSIIQRVAKGRRGLVKGSNLRVQRLLPRTVVSDLVEAVKGMKSGRVVEFRAEGEGLIRAPLGRIEFSREQLLENCKCLVSEVLKAQPRSRSGGGEAASGSAKQLQWPPPSFLSRRRQRLSRDADASGGAI
ncbi:hypothetical protein Emag_000317 [Eimeria magna]